MSFVFSSPEQLNHIKKILSRYIRLPFSVDTIPGAIMEAVIGHVRLGLRLNTYDFIDVHQPNERVGWQVKSTKSTTPVTWKRAKIPNQENLMTASLKSPEGLKALGDAIIEFCNAHARESIAHYNLEEIGYARLIIFPDGNVRYFERQLCTRENPNIFNPKDFVWNWSTQKNAVKKEQLSALRGVHVPTGKKWWAWHGRGENQLHFSGEREWWPPMDSHHAIAFRLPSDDEKISLDRLMDLLEAL